MLTVSRSSNMSTVLPAASPAKRHAASIKPGMAKKKSRRRLRLAFGLHEDRLKPFETPVKVNHTELVF